MSDDELGDLDWLTWEWIVELAQSGSDTPEEADHLRNTIPTEEQK